MEIEIISSKSPKNLELEQVRDFYEFTQKSKSDSSRRTYHFGWKRFTEWCMENHADPYDANSVALTVGRFLSSMAKERKLKLSSLNTYLAAIKHHLWENKRIEVDHPEIRRAMKGIRNDMRGIRKDKKQAILVEDLHKILSALHGSDKLIDVRDKAILLFGFSGAFRRSELAGIHLEHLRFDEGGVTVLLPWSKTDQEGVGQYVQIPNGKRTDTCPVTSIKAWLERSRISEGAVFRAITRHGVIQKNKITDKAVALIVKKRAGAFFDKKNIAGHSLRRGLVTSALEAKVPETVVMRQTRHSSVNMLKEYYQDLKDYQNNALRSLNL